MQQGYHFPPPDAGSGLRLRQSAARAAPQQWGQPQPDPRGYELAYQTYARAPIRGRSSIGGARPAAGLRRQRTPTTATSYYEDEEPRRGKRWILITVALVGAIGVGGALAYTYRSLVAPQSGRVPVVKATPTSRPSPSSAAARTSPAPRDGRRYAAEERRRSGRPPEPAPRRSASGRRTWGRAWSRPSPSPRAALQRRPSRRPPRSPASRSTGRRSAAGLSPSRRPACAPPLSSRSAPKAVQPPPPSRVAIGSRPPPAAEAEEEAPAAPPPARRSVPVQTAAAGAKAPAGEGRRAPGLATWPCCSPRKRPWMR